MVQNGNGYEEYKNEDNTWPGADYFFKEAKCIDNNGALVENAITFESISKTVILETDKTVMCTLYFDESILVKLKENEKLLNKDNLSSDLQGGMHRYQGTDDVTNWICFGTTDNCGTSDTLIDKYMYRIIGITPNGELYLLKETFLKEGETTGFAWNTKYNISDCLGYACERPNGDLFKRLNGTSNGKTIGNIGDTNIFINSGQYEYMQEGSKWYNLIENHNWMYGDTLETFYIGNEMYAIEAGKIATKRYWPDEEQNTCSSDNLCTEKEYTWNQSIQANVYV